MLGTTEPHVLRFIARGGLPAHGVDGELRAFRNLCKHQYLVMDDCAIEALRTRGEDQTEMLAVLSAFREQGLAFS